MAHGITESVTLSTAEPAPAPPVPQLCDGYFAKYEGEKDMAMDVTFEDEQETITGATVVPGVKMTDAPKPAAPPASQAPAPSKKADAAPASTGDAASLLGKAEGKE